MPDEIVVPAAALDSAIEAHAEMDAAAHQQIANTEDEDYKWLTDRLDALQTEVATLRTMMASTETRDSEILSAFQLSQESARTMAEQNRTLIEAQTRMIETLTANLTALSESALLKSIPPESEISSQIAPPNGEQIAETITVAEVVPGNHAPHTVQRSAESGKKRTRI
jgi:hypothetical protein